jgi:hypothetical protein
MRSRNVKPGFVRLADACPHHDQNCHVCDQQLQPDPYPFHIYDPDAKSHDGNGCNGIWLTAAQVEALFYEPVAVGVLTVYNGASVENTGATVIVMGAANARGGGTIEDSLPADEYYALCSQLAAADSAHRVTVGVG